MTVFKSLGLLLVLISCTFLGFYKSFKLNLRKERLNEICLSLEKLAELIKCSSEELNELLILSFGEDLLCFSEGRPRFNGVGLLKEDEKLINSLFEEMGISQRENEYKRIMLYKTMLSGKAQEAQGDVNSLSKLYSSVGFLIGLVICIFLI